MIYTVHIVQPKHWPHVRMFIPTAGAIAKALRDLGHEVYFEPGTGSTVTNASPKGRSIIFGANFLPDVPLAPDAILFNTEQVPAQAGSGPNTTDSEVLSQWLESDFLNLYRRHEVWDYSTENIRRLRMLGVEKIKHCPLGFSDALCDVPEAEEDIDVLFYGTMSERRMRVLQALDQAQVRTQSGTRPLRLAAVQGVYGTKLNELIGRAKIVLNCYANWPHIAPAIFEMVRVSHLLSNVKCVVSEAGGHDQELNDFALQTTVSVPFDKLVKTCLFLLDETSGAEESKKIRAGIASQGFAVLKDQVFAVKQALA